MAYRISAHFVNDKDRKFRFRWGKNYLTPRRALQAIAAFKAQKDLTCLSGWCVEHFYGDNYMEARLKAAVDTSKENKRLLINNELSAEMSRFKSKQPI